MPFMTDSPIQLHFDRDVPFDWIEGLGQPGAGVGRGHARGYSMGSHEGTPTLTTELRVMNAVMERREARWDWRREATDELSEGERTQTQISQETDREPDDSFSDEQGSVTTTAFSSVCSFSDTSDEESGEESDEDDSDEDDSDDEERDEDGEEDNGVLETGEDEPRSASEESESDAPPSVYDIPREGAMMDPEREPDLWRDASTEEETSDDERRSPVAEPYPAMHLTLISRRQHIRQLNIMRRLRKQERDQRIARECLPASQGIPQPVTIGIDSSSQEVVPTRPANPVIEASQAEDHSTMSSPGARQLSHVEIPVSECVSLFSSPTLQAQFNPDLPSTDVLRDEVSAAAERGASLISGVRNSDLAEANDQMQQNASVRLSSQRQPGSSPRRGTTPPAQDEIYSPSALAERNASAEAPPAIGSQCVRTLDYVEIVVPSSSRKRRRSMSTHEQEPESESKKARQEASPAQEEVVKSLGSAERARASSPLLGSCAASPVPEIPPEHREVILTDLVKTAGIQSSSDCSTVDDKGTVVPGVDEAAVGRTGELPLRGGDLRRLGVLAPIKHQHASEPKVGTAVTHKSSPEQENVPKTEETGSTHHHSQPAAAAEIFHRSARLHDDCGVAATKPETLLTTPESILDAANEPKVDCCNQYITDNPVASVDALPILTDQQPFTITRGTPFLPSTMSLALSDPPLSAITEDPVRSSLSTLHSRISIAFPKQANKLAAAAASRGAAHRQVMHEAYIPQPTPILPRSFETFGGQAVLVPFREPRRRRPRRPKSVFVNALVSIPCDRDGLRLGSLHGHLKKAKA
ncbi:hypothetical protein LTR66_002789 [Elasticomyces elasticus]|nr:hypothetical protein LTR66_002789 [Elasticomyces elasticus]